MALRAEAVIHFLKYFTVFSKLAIIIGNTDYSKKKIGIVFLYLYSLIIREEIFREKGNIIMYETTKMKKWKLHEPFKKLKNTGQKKRKERK